MDDSQDEMDLSPEEQALLPGAARPAGEQVSASTVGAATVGASAVLAKQQAQEKAARLKMLLWILVGVSGLAAYHFWPKPDNTYRIPVSTGKIDHSFVLLAETLSAGVKGGDINFDQLKANPQPLKDFLYKISATHPLEYEKLTDEQRKAFLLNVYQASLLNLIVDHWPVSRVAEIREGFKSGMNIRCVRFLGKKYSLKEFEELWVKRLNDSRVEKVLWKWTDGKAPLMPVPYGAGSITTQMEAQLRAVGG